MSRIWKSALWVEDRRSLQCVKRPPGRNCDFSSKIIIDHPWTRWHFTYKAKRVCSVSNCHLSFVD